MENLYITPDILEVKALDNYRLYLIFGNGEEKIFDMKSIINNSKMYFRLVNKEYFQNVKTRGDTVEWENGEDVAPEELYHNSIIVNKNTKNN